MFSSSSCRAWVACSAICCGDVDSESRHRRLWVADGVVVAVGDEHWVGEVPDFLRSIPLLGVVDILKMIFWLTP